MLPAKLNRKVLFHLGGNAGGTSTSPQEFLSHSLGILLRNTGYPVRLDRVPIQWSGYPVILDRSPDPMVWISSRIGQRFRSNCLDIQSDQTGDPIQWSGYPARLDRSPNPMVWISGHIGQKFLSEWAGPPVHFIGVFFPQWKWYKLSLLDQLLGGGCESLPYYRAWSFIPTLYSWEITNRGENGGKVCDATWLYYITSQNQERSGSNHLSPIINWFSSHNHRVRSIAAWYHIQIQNSPCHTIFSCPPVLQILNRAKCLYKI